MQKKRRSVGSEECTLRKNSGRILAVVTAALIFGSSVTDTMAYTANDIAYLEQQQAETNQSLSELQSSIDSLEDDKAQLVEQLDEYELELMGLITELQALDTEIADSETKLSEIRKDLAAARKDQETQYEAMKTRIQYLYESGGESGWMSLLLNLDDISRVLDDVTNTQSLYNYDRKELEAYAKAAAAVEELENQQVIENSELGVMKERQEAEKSRLEDLVDQARAESDNFDAQLSEAYAAAEQYLALMEEQNAQISALYAQQAAAAAAYAAAANAAAQQNGGDTAAGTAAGQTQDAAGADNGAEGTADPGTAAGGETPAVDNTGSNASGNTGSSTGNSGSGSTPAVQQPASPAPSTPVPTVAPTPVPTQAPAPAPTYSATGQDVVNYALQFIGTPYVSCGADLINGCDCVGFTYAVYAHFGVYLPRDPIMQGSYGTGVSINDIQPGDLITYSHGHAGIYIGGGQMVHAANPAMGVCVGGPITYKPIYSIRRFF